jgi:serine/threonine protein kinase
MSEVYLAVARGPAGFNKLVVIKRLLSGLVAEAHFLDMFLDEARLAARLNHPNIVQTNEVGFADEKYFIAMEYLDGQPLLKLVQRVLPEPLAVHVALAIGAKICAGLHYAHTLADFGGSPLGIVHRDVSPHNIFVTYNGQVKIVDFGIAKAASRTTETETGILKGKIAYMSPEHIGGVELDGRSDLFSLGVVLYEALSGQRMWGSPTRDVNIVKRLVQGDVPCSPRALVPSIPEDVDRIVQKALAVDREQRYESALDMQADLEAAMARLPTRASEREIGELIANLFAEERQTIAGVVEKQIALLDATNSEEFAMHSLPALHSAAGVMSMTPILKDAPSSPAVGSHWSWKASWKSASGNSTSTHRRRTILVLLALFGVLATFAVWGFSQTGSERTAPSAASLAAKPPASAVTALPEPVRSASNVATAPGEPAPAHPSDTTPAARMPSSLAIPPGAPALAPGAPGGPFPVSPAAPYRKFPGGAGHAPPTSGDAPPSFPTNAAPAAPPAARTPAAPPATYGPLDDRH